MRQQDVRARITPTEDLPLATPEGVGLCLSGGGSRAMTAGLGQLRALRHVQLNDETLLSKVQAISSVSGGSWLSVAWTFLPDDVSDDDFLGVYQEPESLSTTSLSTVNGTSPGNNIGHDFSVFDMLIEVVGLRLVHRTPWNSMWQIIMGRRLLEPYGLYTAGPKAEPSSTFSRDADTKQQALVDRNPKLADDTVHLVASGPDRTTRALLMCNGSLFVNELGSEEDLLVPVLFTPTEAGVLSSPGGVTTSGAPVGGGVVDAFAFGSALLERDQNDVVVLQRRQLALADIVGISSAAFSETVQNLGDTTLAESAREHRKYVRERLKIERALGEHPKTPSIFDRIADWFRAFLMQRVLRELSPRDLVPRYRYWPVRDPEPNQTIGYSRFADGGSLENTGVASMLTRTGIDRIVACLNSENELVRTKVGVVDVGSDGTVTEEPGTQIQVASEVAYLFGYQEHNTTDGYRTFAGVPDAEIPTQVPFRHNQVFESSSFSELLRKFAEAAGTGLRTHPVVVQQDLKTVENQWFGVEGGRCVTVVWVYLNPVDEWTERLTPEVRQLVEHTKGFPNYSTFDTELDATRFNLLSGQTAWSLACDSSAELLRALFKSPATSC